jgi:hypothetical protein
LPFTPHLAKSGEKSVHLFTNKLLLFCLIKILKCKNVGLSRPELASRQHFPLVRGMVRPNYGQVCGTACSTVHRSDQRSHATMAA